KWYEKGRCPTLIRSPAAIQIFADAPDQEIDADASQSEGRRQKLRPKPAHPTEDDLTDTQRGNQKEFHYSVLSFAPETRRRAERQSRRQQRGQSVRHRCQVVPVVEKEQRAFRRANEQTQRPLGHARSGRMLF